MKYKGNFFLGIVVVFLMLSFLTSCNSEVKESSNTPEDLSEQNLFIYCGAGMTKPFEKIVEAYKTETGVDIEVVYANAAQIQTQITTTGEGDLFISGSAEELEPIKDFVVESKDLVKHIPVLAVKSGNPLKITGIKDLTKEGVEVVLGDADATPIGKIANKAMSDLGILKSVNVVARTTTAPEMFTALSVEECDAIIVWKENVNGSDVEIVETTDLDKYIKTVPAASLSSSKNKKALKSFLEFLDADKAKSIWENYGYELLN